MEIVQGEVIKLVLAVILGGLIGLEREYRRKPAGLKTYSLVALGATLFTLIGASLFSQYQGVEGVSYDPSRIIASIVAGIGFIGGGLIIRRQFTVEGLTTAAGLWIAAALGVAIGVGLYFLSIVATILSLFILHFLRSIEDSFLRKKHSIDKRDEKQYH